MPKKPFVDMSQYEVPDGDPMTEGELNLARAVAEKGRRELAIRAALAGMTPMEFIAAGRAQSNTPTEAERQLPGLLAPVREVPLEENKAAPQLPPPSTRIQQWFDEGRGAEPFLEGFFSGKVKPVGPAPTEVPADDEIAEGEIVGLEPRHLELGDVIDAEVVDE